MKKAEPEYYPPVENLLDLIYEHYTENKAISGCCLTLHGKTILPDWYKLQDTHWTIVRLQCSS